MFGGFSFGTPTTTNSTTASTGFGSGTLFGTQSNANSAFGAASTSATAGGGGIFGQTANTGFGQQQGGSAFSTNSTTASTGFGSGTLFGTQSNANSAFGAASTSATAGGGGIFGQTANTGFGQQQGGSAFSFGSTPSSNSTLFGNGRMAGTGSLLSTPVVGSSFGSEPGGSDGTAFGSQDNASTFFGAASMPATCGGLFGNTVQVGGPFDFRFGAATPAGLGTQLTFGGFGSTTTQPSTGGLFGGGTSGTPSFSFGGATPSQGGSTIAFMPPSGQDTMMKGGVTTNINTRHQCITAMKEYENKCIEELRMEDYSANRKTKQPDLIFRESHSHGRERRRGQRIINQKGKFGTKPTGTSSVFGRFFGQPASTLSSFGTYKGGFGGFGINTGGLGTNVGTSSFGMATTSGTNTTGVETAAGGSGRFGTNGGKPASSVCSFGFHLNNSTNGFGIDTTFTGMDGASNSTNGFGIDTPLTGMDGANSITNGFGIDTTLTGMDGAADKGLLEKPISISSSFRFNSNDFTLCTNTAATGVDSATTPKQVGFNVNTSGSLTDISPSDFRIKTNLSGFDPKSFVQGTSLQGQPTPAALSSGFNFNISANKFSIATTLNIEKSGANGNQLKTPTSVGVVTATTPTPSNTTAVGNTTSDFGPTITTTPFDTITSKSGLATTNATTTVDTNGFGTVTTTSPSDITTSANGLDNNNSTSSYDKFANKSDLDTAITRDKSLLGKPAHADVSYDFNFNNSKHGFNLMANLKIEGFNVLGCFCKKPAFIATSYGSDTNTSTTSSNTIASTSGFDTSTTSSDAITSTSGFDTNTTTTSSDAITSTSGFDTNTSTTSSDTITSTSGFDTNTSTTSSDPINSTSGFDTNTSTTSSDTITSTSGFDTNTSTTSSDTITSTSGFDTNTSTIHSVMMKSTSSVFSTGNSEETDCDAITSEDDVDTAASSTTYLDSMTNACGFRATSRCIIDSADDTESSEDESLY